MNCEKKDDFKAFIEGLLEIRFNFCSLKMMGLLFEILLGI